MPAILLTAALLAAAPLGPGEHRRSIEVDGRQRSYLVHVPTSYDAQTPTPVVLVFHGAGMNARLMVSFSGMSAKAEEAGFIAVYVNGTGIGPLRVFHAGRAAEGRPDEVKYVAALLDDLAEVVRVDPRRVYAAGMSNGGMMCYRLAADLSDRIAAIAAVGGTMNFVDPRPKRPVPVIHFHGTEDRIVPFDGLRATGGRPMRLLSVEETLAAWIKVNRCREEPEVQAYDDVADDGTTATRKTWLPGEGGAEVVLVTIEGGGHTWPGQTPPVGFIGRSTEDISANDLIWEFFARHQLP